MAKNMKMEMYASKSAMKKHEVGEDPKSVAAEKKAGTKDKVTKKPTKKPKK